MPPLKIRVIHFFCQKKWKPEMNFVHHNPNTHTTTYECSSCGEVVDIQEVIED